MQEPISDSVNNKENRKGKTNNPNGRPKGTRNKPRILDYISNKEIDVLIQTAKDTALEGDGRMLVFLLTQILGKPDITPDTTPQKLPIPILDILRH